MASGFVGRGVELALLEGVCLRAQREGRPAAALVTGLPGSGKTRLLAELRSHQARRPLSVVGYPTGAQVPLAAAGDLLRALVKVSAAGQKLEVALFGATPTDDRPLEPLRVFEAAHRALLGLDGTVLIFVDDLQWVDELSLALCSYLVRAADAEGKEVAVIAASRPARADTAWYDSLVRELGSDRVTTLELGPLEHDDGVRLVSQLAPQLTPEQAAHLWTLAQGSPFWLGILARSGGKPELADYLIARERGLTRDAGRLLALLAIAARPLSPPELEALLAWHDTRTEQAIAELERSGLVILDGISIALAHDLIRSSAEAQLPIARRRELHAQFGSWLEQQAAGDVQTLLEALVHRREAGLDVTDLALRVLQSPRRRLLGREGLGNLSQVANSIGFSEPAAAALHEQLALLASELGEHRAALERWTELAGNGSDATMTARCYLGASRAALRIVELREEALPLLDRARSQPTVDPVVEVEIEAHHANLLRLLEHRMGEAQRVATRGVLAARSLWGQRDPTQISSRERDAYVTALQAAFDAAVIEDDASDMLHLAEELAQVARGSEEAMLSAALNTSLALWFLGRTAEAVDHARRVWVQSHERMLPMLTLAAGSTLASKLIEIGSLGEAEEVTSECVELERRVGERLAMGKVAARSIHELRHLVWFSRGDWREAVTSLEHEITLQPDPHYRLHLHGIMVVWLARCGGGTRSVDIDRHMVAGRTDAAAAGCRRCAREMALRAAEAFARLGRIDDAQKMLQAWDADARPAEPGDQLWRKHVGALIALAKLDPTTSLSELEAVVAERRRRGLVAGLLWARLDLAAALIGSDARRAANELRQAGVEASAAGAATERRLAELGLRRLGVRTWRRGRASGGEAAVEKLSDRERQIAILVAAGNSNPEIANTLFLSRKTIERHVSNVLARTGARNRTDLARLLSNLTPPPLAEPDRVLPRS
jgi:DNA-binding CsgD family transcriptional regulator